MKKYKQDIGLVIFVIIVLSSIIIKKPLDNLDEIWNYNTARAISEGLIPYKDVSMITTPLLPIVTAIFLKTITNELILSRILAILLCSSILYMVYKIFRKLIKEENISIICTILIGLLFRDIYCIDYNFTVLLIALIILYKELKNIESFNNKKQDFIVRYLGRFSYLY